MQVPLVKVSAIDCIGNRVCVAFKLRPVICVKHRFLHLAREYVVIGSIAFIIFHLGTYRVCNIFQTFQLIGLAAKINVFGHMPAYKLGIGNDILLIFIFYKSKTRILIILNVCAVLPVAAL